MGNHCSCIAAFSSHIRESPQELPPIDAPNESSITAFIEPLDQPDAKSHEDSPTEETHTTATLESKIDEEHPDEVQSLNMAINESIEETPQESIHSMSPQVEEMEQRCDADEALQESPPPPLIELSEVKPCEQDESHRENAPAGNGRKRRRVLEDGGKKTTKKRRPGRHNRNMAFDDKLQQEMWHRKNEHKQTFTQQELPSTKDNNSSHRHRKRNRRQSQRDEARDHRAAPCAVTTITTTEDAKNVEIGRLYPDVLICPKLNEPPCSAPNSPTDYYDERLSTAPTERLHSPKVQLVKESTGLSIPPLVFDLPPHDDLIPTNNISTPIDTFRSVDELEYINDLHLRQITNLSHVPTGMSHLVFHQFEPTTDNSLRSPPATERRPRCGSLEQLESVNKKERPATARPNLDACYRESQLPLNKQGVTTIVSGRCPNNCFSTTSNPSLQTGSLALGLGKCLAASLLQSPRLEPKHRRT